MVILGIDPGSRRVGYGLVQKEEGRLKLLSAGLLKIRSQKNPEVIVEIKNQVDYLIKKFDPEVLAIEKLYFSKNQKTAFAVAEARGAILLSAAENHLIVKEYSPNEVKASLTGYGLADKKATAKMVKIILGQPELKVIDDITDALAIAIVAIQRKPS